MSIHIIYVYNFQAKNIILIKKISETLSKKNIYHILLLLNDKLFSQNYFSN